MQAKILKVIEEKRVRRIGSDNVICLDLKIISATNKNPLQCVRENILREDLFYRLSTVFLDIPPLRRRRLNISSSDCRQSLTFQCGAFSFAVGTAEVEFSIY